MLHWTNLTNVKFSVYNLTPAGREHRYSDEFYLSEDSTIIAEFNPRRTKVDNLSIGASYFNFKNRILDLEAPNFASVSERPGRFFWRLRHESPSSGLFFSPKKEDPLSRPAVTPSVDHWLRGRVRLRPARLSLNFYRFAKSLISSQPIQVSRAFSDWSDKLLTFVPASSGKLRPARFNKGKKIPGVPLVYEVKWSEMIINKQA